jgi:hypothetical protein
MALVVSWDRITILLVITGARLPIRVALLQASSRVELSCAPDLFLLTGAGKHQG